MKLLHIDGSQSSLANFGRSSSERRWLQIFISNGIRVITDSELASWFAWPCVGRWSTKQKRLFKCMPLAHEFIFVYLHQSDTLLLSKNIWRNIIIIFESEMRQENLKLNTFCIHLILWNSYAGIKFALDAFQSNDILVIASLIAHAWVANQFLSSIKLQAPIKVIK